MTDTQLDRIVGEFFSLEDDPVILRYRFSHLGSLIWPFIRIAIADQLLQARSGSPNPHPVPRFNFLRFARPTVCLRYAWHLVARDPLRKLRRDRRHFNVVILNSAIGNSSQREGKYYNRLSDYFGFALADQTFIAEMSAGFDPRQPRCFPNIACQDSLVARAAIVAVARRIDPGDACAIDSMCDYLHGRIGPVFDRPALVQYLGIKARQIPFLDRYYRQFFELAKPRLLLIEDGSYGGQANIIRLAKGMGITVAEFQHGLIAKTHWAYNYGTALRESFEYRECLPDYLLTYGRYWNEQVNTPSEKIAIGNPHLSSMIERYRDHPDGSGSLVILIASDGINHQQMAGITKGLALLSAGDNYRIIFKLHPIEAGLVAARYRVLLPLPNVALVDGGDIFQYLFESDVVVSSYSTVTFEAFGLGKPVYILDGPLSRSYLPQAMGTRFSSAEELYRLIRRNAERAASGSIGYLWESDWQGKYLRFLCDAVGIRDLEHRHAGEGEAGPC